MTQRINVQTESIRYFQFVDFTFKFIWHLMPIIALVRNSNAEVCPTSQAILPCRCSLRGKEIQIWCSHSNLPQIMDGIKAIERNIKTPIHELVLENNQLPALSGRFFGTLEIVRLMLRYNSIERVSNGWLNDLENSLVEIYIVEPQLRSIPVESLNGMINIIAITIHSENLKRLPNFSGLLSLTYLSVQSISLTELQPHFFRHLPKLENININGGLHLNRLEAGLFDGLISLKNIDLSHNGINWIHLRTLSRLPNLNTLKLSYNSISDVGMIGRIVKDLKNLKKLRLDHNIINVIEDGSFVDLFHLTELHLNDNRIKEIKYGAFLRTPMLKTVYLHNNHVRRIHPESFLQASGRNVETLYIYNNKIEHVGELRSLLDALPTLKFIDMSNNLLVNIPYGSLRGHGTLEKLYLNNNKLRIIDQDGLMAMPALQELRMRNNSLSNELSMPFWNLPGLKGLDLSQNNLRVVDSYLLSGLPSLCRLDLSENGLSALDPAAFIHNLLLETLNISVNELMIIHPATFHNLNRLFEVDASFNQLTQIIPGMAKIVERISMRGNLISFLPMSPSKSLNLPNLRMLDISLNSLENLPKYGFQGLPELRVLSLANNRLSSLDDTTFIGSEKLELLHLQHNMLSRIDERTFISMPALRNLNLEGNKLEIITDNMFSNNTRLEQLDLSRNHLRSISPAAFDSKQSLEYLDLSGNTLSDISISVSNLINLRDIDLSNNKISHVHANIVTSWRNVIEIRLSNNLITELKHGTFINLPKLQYLDLSSNEINTVEEGALKNLPDLEEFVLADNKLVELKDRVFEELPNLLAAHFQYNSLRYISTESFHNSPSIVFLNLSNNNFFNMENIGLRNMRNVEVLDLSTNHIKMVSAMPLKVLSWIVELKMDNNKICKIEGLPFETMPRLRVLSMRNNHLRTMKERTFRNLRGNIAIFDVDGNPIVCSCEMQWLSVWLEETNFPYPGPKCNDGRLLRTFRTEKSLCSSYNNNNQRTGGVTSDSFNHLPLLNEHGDIFHREMQEENNEDCNVFDTSPGERPLVGESEYFLDQYVDYTPTNDTGLLSTDLPTSITQLDSNDMTINQKKSFVSPNIDLNTILNTNYIKKPGMFTPHSTSPFTFFGYPIPSLSLGRFFGTAQRGRKNRGENTVKTPQKSMTAIPATHRMHTPGSRVRMYQPNSAEFEKYLNQKPEYQDATSRHKYLDSRSEEGISNEMLTNIFKTAFHEPSSIEHGGFRPIVPDQIRGFMPVGDPTIRRSVVVAATQASPLSIPHKRANTNSALHFIPVATDSILQTNQSTTGYGKNISPYSITSPKKNIETQSHGSTELITLPLNDITIAYTTTTMSTISTYIISNSTMSTSTIQDLQANNVPLHTELSDLETQSVVMLRPPPKVREITAKTILLIPPTEEHTEHLKQKDSLMNVENLNANSNETTTRSQYAATSSNIQKLMRPTGGRPIITKVFTPQTPHQYLPTAEEYYRTTSNEYDLIADAQKSNYQITERTTRQHVDHTDRKNDMDWYYDSFKIERVNEANSNNKNALSGSSLRSGDDKYSTPKSTQTTYKRFAKYLWIAPFIITIHNLPII